MSRLPETGMSLTRWLRQQERKAQRQQQSSAFNLSGTSVTAEGAQSLDGTLTVTPGTGFVSIDGSLGVHGTAAFDGSTTIGGDLVVAGTLSLPNAIIPNDALANFIIPAVVNLSATNFAVPANAELVGVDLVVPAGCTRLMVNAAMWVYAKNTTAAFGAIGVRTNLTVPAHTWLEEDGQQFIISLAVAANDTVIAPLAALIETLTPGETVRLLANCTASGATWPADANNVANLTATLLWLR